MKLNSITLVGRVGGDPNVKHFESGSVVCNLTLAVKRPVKGGDEPDWFDITLWGKTAEVAAAHVTKGSQIGVTGQLEFEYWKDRTTGGDRSKPVVRVERLDLLGSKRDGGVESNAGVDEF